jgi:hypothetical protein
MAPEQAVALWGVAVLHKRVICLPLLLALAVLPSTSPMPARAADLPLKAVAAPVAASGWTYQFTAYGWLTAVNGSQTARGRTVDIDATFIDIIKESNSIIALMGYFEARNGPWGIFSDLVYADITASGGRSRTFSGHVAGAVLGASLSADYQMAILTLGGAYEVARWNSGPPGPRGVPYSFTALDVIAGGRYWWQKVDLNLDLATNINILGLTISGNRAIAKSGSVDWLDPFIGLRLRHQFAPGHELMLAGDIGGFGVGSDFTWQLVGAYSWEFCVRENVRWSAVLGYRALSVDYSQGVGINRFEYDAITHGPLLGVSARF